MASKQPRRSDLTSDLKSMAQTTYVTMFVWTDLAVLKLFCIFLERRKKKKENLALLDLSASPQVKQCCRPQNRSSVRHMGKEVEFGAMGAAGALQTFICKSAFRLSPICEFRSSSPLLRCID